MPMNFLIKGLISWKPLANPVKGYTIVIGCMHKIPEILYANCELICRENRENLHELLLVFDTTEKKLPSEIKSKLSKLSKLLPIRYACYTPLQDKIASMINWGWVYAWLSWSIAIGITKTRYLLLHDLDAMPIKGDIFEKLYDNALKNNVIFQGIRLYEGNGVLEKDGIVTTFEMVMNTEFIRSKFRPFDGFNRLVRESGRIIDYDTFLYMQSVSKNSRIAPVSEEDLVHPSQLICQYTNLISNRGNFDGLHNLLLLPVFSKLGGNSEDLAKIVRFCRNEDSYRLPYKNKWFSIKGITITHWNWIEKQIKRLMAVFDREIIDEITDYLHLMRQKIERNQKTQKVAER